MQRNTWFLAASGVAASALLARWQLQRWFSEEPEYEVEHRAGSIEIRRYARSVRAETNVQAETWDQALREGFQRLADYIHGSNHPRKLAARGDVVLARSERGVPIRMISPVTARIESTPDPVVQPTLYTISFAMPKSHAAGELPVPLDARVHLRAMPARRVAVLRYRGRHTFANVRDKSAYLREVLERAGFATRGVPEFAAYDPPSTLPALRRNEIFLELGSRKTRGAADMLLDVTTEKTANSSA